MLDELREQAESSRYYDEDENGEYQEIVYTAPAYDDHEDYFLGMSPGQRFVLSLMLFVIVFFLGAFLLLITGRVVPPQIF